MPSERQLTESAIRRWTGAAAFEQGERDFRQRSILDPHREGNALKARCLGSIPSPYHVQVTLVQGQVVSGECSCPKGAGGQCRHIAALLLAWLHQPAAFREAEDLEAGLARRTKAELIALVAEMLARRPELEAVVRASDASGVRVGRSPDPDFVGRWVAEAFAGIDPGEWRAARQVAQKVSGLVSIGDEHARREDWASAVTIYRSVAEQVLDGYWTVEDEQWELHPVVDACVGGLGECLRATDEPNQREALLGALFAVYRWDTEAGGVDIGYQVPAIILKQATPAEKDRVAGWVREAMPTGDTWPDAFRSEVYGGFLLALEGQRPDDESFLRICYETGRWPDLVERLLALDRVDEALDVASQVGDARRLQVADVFVSHGRVGLAEKLVRERLRDSDDMRLADWLRQRAEARGDLAEAASLAETLFWQEPSVAGYRELSRLATPLGRWHDLRTLTLAKLAAGEHYRLLAEIYLGDGEVDQALLALRHLKDSSSARDRGPHAHDRPRVDVIRAEEQAWPGEAAQLYVSTAEWLSAACGRGNYGKAAWYLARVRELYLGLGQWDAWEDLIADVRDQNRGLHALHEELDEAGL